MGVIKSLKDNLPLSSRDFAENEMFAFIYGITVGWGGTDYDHEEDLLPGIKEEFKEKFGWTEEDWKDIELVKALLDKLSDNN